MTTTAKIFMEAARNLERAAQLERAKAKIVDGAARMTVKEFREFAEELAKYYEGTSDLPD